MKKSVGRPPKFNEARRPITLTLPERILEKLSLIDEDRARAIVHAVDEAMPDEHNPVLELVEVMSGQSLIVVGMSRCLQRIPGVRLVAVAPGRFLIALPAGSSIQNLEIALLDLLEHLPEEERGEAVLLSGLREKISQIRRSKTVTKAEILFVSD